MKDAIDNVIDNPKKYFNEVINKLETIKKDCYIWLNNYDKNKEKIAQELDKLNNNDSLKKIWNYTKKNMSEACFYTGGGVCGDEYIEQIIKDFDCNEYKAIAIALISGAFGEVYKKNHKKDSDYNHSSGYRSNSSRRRGAAIAASSAVAVALKRR